MADGKRQHDGSLCGELWALQANCNRDPKQRSRPFEPRDVFPYLPKRKRKRMTATAEEKAQIAKEMSRGR